MKTPDKLREILLGLFREAKSGSNIPATKYADQAIKSIEELFDKRFKETVDAEEELIGTMPDKLWNMCRKSIGIMEETMRSCVRQTKNNIRKRWQESKEGK